MDVGKVEFAPNPNTTDGKWPTLLDALQNTQTVTAGQVGASLWPALHAQLDRIEAKLDALIAEKENR